MLYWVFNTPILLYSTCWFLPTEYIEFGYSFGDLDTLIKNVSIAAVHSVANLKLLMWLTHKDEILGMIGTYFFWNRFRDTGKNLDFRHVGRDGIRSHRRLRSRNNNQGREESERNRNHGALYPGRICTNHSLGRSNQRSFDRLRKEHRVHFESRQHHHHVLFTKIALSGVDAF